MTKKTRVSQCVAICGAMFITMTMAAWLVVTMGRTPSDFLRYLCAKGNTVFVSFVPTDEVRNAVFQLTAAEADEFIDAMIDGTFTDDGSRFGRTNRMVVTVLDDSDGVVVRVLVRPGAAAKGTGVWRRLTAMACSGDRLDETEEAQFTRRFPRLVGAIERVYLE